MPPFKPRYIFAALLVLALLAPPTLSFAAPSQFMGERTPYAAFDKLWRDLGTIPAATGTTFDAAAPLAATRRAIEAKPG
jgi:hypothetical protein